MLTKSEVTRERLVAVAERLILAQGYSGMSLDDLLREVGLTKGAFFHHFGSKAELAQAVVERYALTDFALFEEWSARADRLAEDPFERMLIFLRLFEEFLDGLAEPLKGCVFASFTYESAKLAPEVHGYIRERLQLWQALYEAKLEAVIAARLPVKPVTARELAEMMVTLIEGAFVTANIYRDRQLMQRQSRRFREYLELLFRPPVESRGA